MKALDMNFRKLAFACSFFVSCSVFVSADVNAQVANVSTTAASSFNSLNLTTGMVSAISNTYFTNDGDTGLLIKGGGSAVTATIITQATSISQAGYGSTALTSLVVPVPANAYVYVGPFPTGRWNTQFGTVAVSFTSVTGVSVSAISQSQ